MPHRVIEKLIGCVGEVSGPQEAANGDHCYRPIVVGTPRPGPGGPDAGHLLPRRSFCYETDT